MAKHMKLLWIAGAILLAVGGAAVASNMGFKFVPNLATGDPDIYQISLPFNNNYVDIQDVFDDISASAGCSAAAVTVFHPDQSTCAWTGSLSCNEAVGSARGVRVGTIGPCTGWVIVGSHNPALTVSVPLDPLILDASIPYHTTKTDLAGLFSEIPNAAQVTKFNADQSTCGWTGPLSCNVPITIGESYRISATVAGPWSPSHY